MTLKHRFREARRYSLSQDLTKTNALQPGFFAGIDCQREMDWKHYPVTFVTHPCLVRW